MNKILNTVDKYGQEIGAILLFVSITLFTFYFGIKARDNKPVPTPVVVMQFTIPKEVSKEFSPYVDNFVRASKIYSADTVVLSRLPSLKMAFGNTRKFDPKFVGVCQTATNNVIIDKPHWEKLNNQEKQALIDHELGHCLLGRAHRHKALAINETLFPKSLMYPHTMRGTVSTEEYDEFRKELFDLKYVNTLNNLYAAMDWTRINAPTIKLSNKETRDRLEQLFNNYANGDISQVELEASFNNEVLLSKSKNLKNVATGSK